MLNGKTILTFETVDGFEQIEIKGAMGLIGVKRLDVEQPDGNSVLVREIVQSKMPLRQYTVSALDGYTVTVDGDNQFRTIAKSRVGWTRAKQLNPGTDAILCTDGIYRRVTDVSIGDDEPSYALIINGRDNVIAANGIAMRGGV